jgi:hypothetical protein
MTIEPAADWESRYRDGATAWERPGLNDAYLTWRDHGLLNPCRILVPGGGRSAEPLAMAEAGFDVTVVDLAESAVAAQRARLEHLHVRARVERADLLVWEPAEKFDAIYDQTCLCALPPAAWPEYEQRLHRWIKPDGRLFVLFMQTHTAGGPPFHCDLDAMRALFAATRWQWPAHLDPQMDHPSGRSEQPAMLRPIAG